MTKNSLAVLFSNKCFVYSLPQPKKRLEIETGWNDGPLVDMVDGHVLLIATVSKNKGQLQLTWLHDKPITQLIQAHHSNVRVLALSRNGQYVATASVKGTLVRIFETRTGKLLYEFRRGSDPATIYAIQFDLECTRIAVTSDKGTIHVFLLDPKEIENHRNPLITPLSPYLPKYFSSDWSMCAISLPTQAKAMVMLNKSDLFCICTDGCYFHYSYNIHGNYRLESFYNYLEL
ncbi:WD40-repeat-containing domain protein [Gorgonomyces haynaldii]|nr:WD40-repeat-containing domain protein [Gorgonomyces haynaldii]